MTKTPSSSTLARRARAEKNPRKAKALRAVANEARRAEREAAKLTGGTQQHLDQVKRMNRAVDEGRHSGIVVGLDPKLMQIDDNAARAASPDSMPLVALPWYQREEEIAKLMKAAKKPEEFKRELSNMIHASRYDGRVKALSEHDGAISENNQRWAINFVSGFLARMNAEAKANGGPLPRSVVVDGVTMARVVDALEKAGYTPDGLTGLRRAVGR